MLFLWPQVAWHTLRPGDLFRVPQPLSDGNCKMQVCCGLCCVRPLSGEDKHTVVPLGVYWPFGHGSSTSDGTHSRRWSAVPEPISVPPHLIQLNPAVALGLCFEREGHSVVLGENLASFSLILTCLCWIYTNVAQNGIWLFWFSLITGRGIYPYFLLDGGEVPEVRLGTQMLSRWSIVAFTKALLSLMLVWSPPTTF